MTVWNGKLLSAVESAAPDDWMPEGAELVDDWMPEGAELVVVKPTKKKGPSAERSGVLGFAQGGTAGFADEIAGKAIDVWDRLKGRSGVRAGAAASPELRARLEETATTGDFLKERMREEARAAAEAHPETYIPGEIAGMVASSVAGGTAANAAGKAIRPVGKGLEVLAKLAKANPLKAAALAGGAQGGAYGAGTSEADTALGVLGDTALGTALGAAGGVVGHGIGAGLSKGSDALRRLTGRKIAELTSKIDDMGLAVAKEGTASARGAAGQSATAAYKNPENIEKALKAGAMTLEELTPEQVALYKGLLRERGLKAAAEMADDAARKTSKGAEYAEQLGTQAERAAEHVKRIGNPWEQLKPRLKRYALPLAGGAAGYLLGDGNPLSVGAGLLTGRGISPTILALMRMTKHPSVQRALLRGLESATGKFGSAAPVAERAVSRAARVAVPELEPALAHAIASREDPEEEQRRALVQALGGRR